MQSKYVLYFFLAVLPSLMGATNPPQTAWDWFKLIGQAVYQGLLAMKALQSLPDQTSISSVTTNLSSTNPSPVINKPVMPLIILFFLCSYLMSCTTAQQAQFAKFKVATTPFISAATPIAEGIVDAFATSKGAGGLTPIINDLFSEGEQAWVGNPPAIGAANPSTATTVAPIIAGATPSVQATALQLAATSLLTGKSLSTLVNN